MAVCLMLAGFLLGIVHDRRLMREAQADLAMRRFIGCGLHERLLDHSSPARIRQRRGDVRFRRIFERTASACVEAGIAKGEVVHVDATPVPGPTRAGRAWPTATPGRSTTGTASFSMSRRPPAKRLPAGSRVPTRRFRCDERNDIVKCPRGKALRPGRPFKDGRRRFHARSRDRAGCPPGGDCVPGSRNRKTVVISADYPALLRARRRRLRWSEEDRRLHDRHRWRSEGFRGEAKTWHGLGRAARRGLGNMRVQSYLTAAAINLKRLAAAFCARFSAIGTIRMRGTALSVLLARQAGPGRRRPARCAWLRAANPRAGRRRVASRNLRKAA